jgi:cathepsin L
MRAIVVSVMVWCGSAYPGQEMGKGFIPPTNFAPMLNDSQLDFDSTTDSIDWSKKGYTTKVKNQGSCGCCWAFAAAEGIESAAKHAHGHLEELSAGQICRCDTNDGGCNGGNPDTAFQYVKSHGLSSEANDPYGNQVHDGKTEHCKWNKHVAAHITGYKQVPQSESSLAAALVKYGPLTICINARVWPNREGSKDWKWTGIAPWAHKCTDEQSDHCVQLVGYDKKASTPYWKLRNQWGDTWGEHGYVRLPYGKKVCGIQRSAYIVEGATLVSAPRRRRSSVPRRRRSSVPRRRRSTEFREDENFVVV